MAWSGECNLCGRCCEATVFLETGMVTFSCIYLLTMDRIGKPGASFCAMHKRKKDGMPILMVSEDKTRSYESHCLSSYPTEKDAVPPECSFVWEGELTKPKWTLTFSPGDSRRGGRPSLPQQPQLP